MKRFLIILFVLVFIAAIPLSHNLMAKKAEKPGKVEICHVNSANDVLELGATVIAFGKVIEVSEKAVAAHEKHGDMAAPGFFYITKEDAEYWEDYYGIKLPNANCLFVK